MSIHAPLTSLNAIVRSDADYRAFLAAKVIVDPMTGLVEIPMPEIGTEMRL